MFKNKQSLSLLEKDYKEFKLQSNKQYVEEVLIQKTAKTTLQRPFDKGFFDSNANADKVVEDFFYSQT